MDVSTFSSTTRPATSTSIRTSSGVLSTSSGSTAANIDTRLDTASELVSTTTEPVQANAQATHSTSPALNKTALIGIIVGGSCFVILVFLAILCLIWRRRRRRRTGKVEREYASSEEGVQAPPTRPSHSRGPSREQVQQRSADNGPVYEAVHYEPQESVLPIPLVHEKDAASGTTTPNVRNSATLESEHMEDVKESTPLDPFASGYIPPPSPTPSEYVIVEHSAEQPLPPRTSRDKRESRSSLLDTIVPEEGAREYSTLGSTMSGRTSGLGHGRTRSGDGTTSPTPPSTKRSSNRLHKRRPSVESRSSFLRPNSPPMSQRSPTPIKFTGDPFNAPLEEEPVGRSRTSLDKAGQTSPKYELRELDAQTSPRPSISGRPSLDTIPAGDRAAGVGSITRKKSHIRSPSSPTRMIPHSPSFIGLGRRFGAASASALSLQHLHEYDPQNAPYLNAHSPTMADASVYDFDIYRSPDEAIQVPSSATNTHVPTSHPPPASAARLSAALNAADVYGSGSSRKRFSASMSDLPTIPSSPGPDALFPFPSAGNRLSTSMSTTQVNLYGREPTSSTATGKSKLGLEPTTNLYIPKESLDLPIS